MNVTLSREQYGWLDDVARDAGVQLFEYSGRGMLGRRCVGVASDDGLPALVVFVAAVTRESDVSERLDEFVDALEHVRSDQLGMGMVYYWPTVNVEQS